MVLVDVELLVVVELLVDVELLVVVVVLVELLVELLVVVELLVDVVGVSNDQVLRGLIVSLKGNVASSPPANVTTIKPFSL